MSKKYAVAEALQKQIRVSDEGISNNGAVTSKSIARPVVSGVTEVTLTLDNSDGAGAVKYNVIGDAFGLVAGARGSAIVADAGPVTPSILNMLSQDGIAIQGFNYEATVSATQLANAPELEWASIGGGNGGNPIFLNGAKRNDQQNTKLLTVQLADFMVVDKSKRLSLTVNAGETVIFTLFIAGAIM